MSEATESTVTAGKVVLFHYTLTNDAGETIDSSAGREPLPYLHGAGNIVPGLEAQMEGRSPGDSFTAIVQPEQGYGLRQGDTQDVPRSAFPDDVDIAEGMQFLAQAPDGQTVPLWVTAVTSESVTVDPNHPLADATLHFAVEIVSMRDATSDELSHGHPHGPDGNAGH